MLNIAICDDNILFAQQTSCEINKILKEHNVEYNTAIFQNGDNLIEAGFFDIIFLDVEMSGMNGIETAIKIRQQKNNCRIIFISSHSKYVFSAFDVAASHYLLKPIDAQKLEAILMKIVNELKEGKEHCYTVKCGTGIDRVPFSQIKFVEVFGRKISLHTKYDTFIFNGKLDELEQAFPDSFFRCHKSYLINLAKVIKYDKGMATLDSYEVVPIARRKFSEFGKAFLKFLSEKGDA